MLLQQTLVSQKLCRMPSLLFYLRVTTVVLLVLTALHNGLASKPFFIRQYPRHRINCLCMQMDRQTTNQRGESVTYSKSCLILDITDMIDLTGGEMVVKGRNSRFISHDQANIETACLEEWSCFILYVVHGYTVNIVTVTLCASCLPQLVRAYKSLLVLHCSMSVLDWSAKETGLLSCACLSVWRSWCYLDWPLFSPQVSGGSLAG